MGQLAMQTLPNAVTLFILCSLQLLITIKEQIIDMLESDNDG